MQKVFFMHVSDRYITLNKYTSLMVQRLSLMGILSLEERPMAVRCLEAISGMLPREFEIERQIWEPKYRYKPSTAGQPMQIEQYRLFVVKSAGRIKIEAYEVPEAGRNIKVISHSVLSSQVYSEEEDLRNYMNDLGYEYKSTHFLKGLEFILYENVIFQLFKLYDGEGNLLDESEQSIVSAYVDVASVTDLNAVEHSTQLLLNIQQELKGIMQLKAPSRGVFNTRMPRVMA